MAEKILMNEFKTLSREKWVNVELCNDNVLEWSIALMVLNPDSLYYGGYFKGKMKFPTNYPYSPPEFTFTQTLYHPNIYPDGRLCISILHPPGDDEMSGEVAAERWSPIQRVESVLLSIISLLDDAECSSPANVDASKMLRDNPEEYKRIVLEDVKKSKHGIPEGFVMPDHHVTMPNQPEKHDDHDFWYDSDQGDDFGGSDTDEEMTQDEVDEDEDAEDDD